MTNYGAIAILAALPEEAPARQLRLLIALETFKAGEDGWRKVGQVLLAETANFSVSTLKRARPELAGAKLIDYQPGLGRGVLSRYRILIPDLKKGPAGGPFSEDVKGSTEDAKRVQAPGQKGSTGETDVSTVTAGQAAQNGHASGAPALGAKAPALKAGALSSPRAARARAGSARAGAPNPPGFRAPPCPECGQPFSQEQLADDDFRAMAMAGEVIHAECVELERARTAGWCEPCQDGEHADCLSNVYCQCPEKVCVERRQALLSEAGFTP